MFFLSTPSNSVLRELLNPGGCLGTPSASPPDRSPSFWLPRNSQFIDLSEPGMVDPDGFPNTPVTDGVVFSTTNVTRTPLCLSGRYRFVQQYQITGAGTNNACMTSWDRTNPVVSEYTVPFSPNCTLFPVPWGITLVWRHVAFLSQSSGDGWCHFWTPSVVCFWKFSFKTIGIPFTVRAKNSRWRLHSLLEKYFSHSKNIFGQNTSDLRYKET